MQRSFITFWLITALLCLFWPKPTQASDLCFCVATPIWWHNSTPAAHEVALFRLVIERDTLAPHAILSIFADTRYEAYLNGNFVGRGPARFSRQHREYDQLSLGDLTPGRHVLIVRVQWAPNFRRSESERPFLWALLQSAGQTLATSGPHWQTQPLFAYRSDAAPVHRWGLIGPTEIVDLRLLPPDWSLMGTESPWQPAVAVEVTPARFTARSIPLTVEVDIPIQRISTGWLGKDFVPIELLSSEDQALVQLQVKHQTMLTLVSLQDELTTNITINGNQLVWSPAPERPPGIVTASYPATVGTHTLRVTGLSERPEGWTIFISRDGLASIPTLNATAHAGRRVLLAPPQADPQAVTVSETPSPTLSFQPPASYAVLDLGRTVHGRLYAEVAGPDGATVDIGWDERLWQQTIPLPFPGELHPEWNQVDSWRLDGREQRLTTIDTRAGRYIVIAVWSNEPVELRNLQVHEERYPVTQIGSFTSDDPLLNRIWQVGVDSLLPNMTDAYTDTPWRERGQWWGDAFVSYHINQVAFGDQLLLRRGLRQLADAFTPEGAPAAMAPNDGGRMLDYGMLWVQAIAADLQRTGDSTLAHELWPTITRFLDYIAVYRQNDTGLLELPINLAWRPSYIDSSVVAARYGRSTPVNAMYYGTLQAAATIAQALSETNTATQWLDEATRVREGINRYLYDSSEHRYVTSIIDEHIIAPGPHAQALPLAYGIVPEAEIPLVATALLDLTERDPARANVQLYGMFWVLEGLRRAGRFNDAINLIKTFYGWQLANGATTWWEHLNSDRFWYASRSHSWSGAPTWFLTTAIVGARQTSPTTWEVIPAWESMNRATGIIPLLSGSLTVTWERIDCGSGRVAIQAPEGTQGALLLPPPSDSTVITYNGEEVWSPNHHNATISQMADGRMRIPLSGGQEHIIERQQACFTIWIPTVQR